MKNHEIAGEITTCIRKLKKTQCFSILFECHSGTNWAVMGKPVSPGLWKGIKTACFSTLFERKCVKPKLFTTFPMPTSRQLPPAREAHIQACRLLGWPLSLHAFGASLFACVSLRTYGKEKREFGAGSPKWPYKTEQDGLTPASKCWGRHQMRRLRQADGTRNNTFKKNTWRQSRSRPVPTANRQSSDLGGPMS